MILKETVEFPQCKESDWFHRIENPHGVELQEQLLICTHAVFYQLNNSDIP